MPSYAGSWETYWAETVAKGQSSLWDCDPEFASARDLPHFAPYLDPEQALIDIGCGNGTQTRYLAQHHKQVIGTDVSASAIKTARAHDPDHAHLVLDLLDTSAVNALHEKLGDASTHMRTVLHQIRPEHRPAFTASSRTLLGANGILAFVELAPGAEDYLHDLVTEYGSPPPPSPGSSTPVSALVASIVTRQLPSWARTSSSFSPNPTPPSTPPTHCPLVGALRFPLTSWHCAARETGTANKLRWPVRQSALRTRVAAPSRSEHPQALPAQPGEIHLKKHVLLLVALHAWAHAPGRRYVRVTAERRPYRSDVCDARRELIEPVLSVWRAERRRYALNIGHARRCGGATCRMTSRPGKRCTATSPSAERA
ncbi:methyltransferase domain-containing protein [Streptomyces sp. TRM70350]|nr:methyltransferase domain-containing protein [Streptomyces sp. TRM70350]